MRRLSVRTRLTLLCSVTVLGCGALMLVALYVLMRYVPTYEIPLSSPAVPATTAPVLADAPAAPAPAPPVVTDGVEPAATEPALGEPPATEPVPGEPMPAAPPAAGPAPAESVPARARADEPVTTVQAEPAPALPSPPAIGSRDDVLTTLLQLSGVALVVLTLVALLAGWVVAGRALAPISRITRTARTVSGGAVGHRIELDGPRDEFTELADTIDAMLDRLHENLQARQRFAANASHELRTPLATTRTVLQVALAHPGAHDVTTLAARLLETNERSITTVESLLALAQADHGIDDAEPVRVDEVAAAAVEHVQDEAAAHGVVLDADLHPATVDGDADLLHHLLVNLLRNAVRHNHVGGRARLAVAVDGGAAVIKMTNTGDLVDAEAADRFFEPFHRRQARTHGGHGLGLTLVRSIAHSHRGEASAVPNPGGGITVTVALPEAVPALA